MKKFLIPLLAILLLAALCAVPMQAAELPVIFIADGATGDGSSADSPMQATTGNYDATASNPKFHLDTALYQAAVKLKETGGTIVICGPVTIGKNQVVGNGANDRDLYLGDNHTAPITITSVYNGVDYRQTNDAKLVLTECAHIVCMGPTVWDNLTVECGNTNRYICAGFYTCVIGEGFDSKPADEANKDDPAYYVSIAGGERYKKVEDRSSDLTINGGTFNSICGAQKGIGANYGHTGDVNLTINNATVLGSVIGTSFQNATPSTGNVNITINGGIYKGTVNGAGAGGFKNEDAMVTVTINGGDFTNCLGINDIDVGVTNNIPKMSVLNVAGYTGDVGVLLSAVSYFDDIMKPEGYAETTTAAPETTTAAPAAEETTAPAAEETTAPAAEETTAPAAEETTAPATSSASKSEGGNTGLIIGIVIVVIVIVAVVIVVLKKKKK